MRGIKILIVPDSFKGSLPAYKVCDAVAEGILDALPDADISALPLADGGEGTVQALSCLPGAITVKANTLDPLMRPIIADYCLVGNTAVIEMAAASGITLLSEDELNPNITTTYGTGLLILDALDKGAKEIIIGIGGSATNDGGAGCLCALGAKFFDGAQNEISLGGSALLSLRKIDVSGLDRRLTGATITAACDVTASLCGENGATNLFAKQKGASPSDIVHLEEALGNYGKILTRTFGKNAFDIVGGGAAGGLGAGLSVACGALLRPGFTLISELTGLEKKLMDTDIVITGEGKTDASSLLGKLPVGVAALAKKYGKICILLSGDIDCLYEPLYRAGFTELHKIRSDSQTARYSIEHAAELLKKKAEEIFTK